MKMRNSSDLPSTSTPNDQRPGFRDAADFGFAPDANGIDNTAALQRAVDPGGTIVVSRPGTYDIAGTVYLGSHTALVFGQGVILRKVAERGDFTHVLLNKGALTKTHDEGIVIEGLHLQVTAWTSRLIKSTACAGRLPSST